MQLNDVLPVVTWSDVQNWFTYNPKEPLLFNTGLFLGLFVIFYGIYILTRKTFRLRLVYVILFSLFFYYKSSGIYFLLLIMSSIVDYTLSYFLYRETRTVQRKVYLWFSVIVNLVFLGYFKYTNFIIDTANSISGSNFTFHNILLPVGISFYSFQSI